MDIMFLNFKLFCSVMGYMWTGGKKGNKLLSCQRKVDSYGQGIEEKEESIVSVCVRSIKMK